MTPVAVVFDLFGTLVNIASLTTAAQRFTSDAPAFVATWREKQIAYTFAASMMNRYEDFDALTGRALRYAAARYGLDAADGRWEQLAGEWRRLRPFDDTLATLVHLRERGIRCAVLTNGTTATATAALHAAGLSEQIEIVLSAEAVRVYKPDPRVYALASAHFGTTPERLVFVSSNGWDVTGAAEFGMAVVWCNRAAAPAETFGRLPIATISALSTLAETLERSNS